MDRARFDELVLPYLVSQIEADNQVLLRGFSPSELDVIFRNCRMPATENPPEPKDVLEVLEISLEDEPFHGEFWEGIRSTDPELGKWLKARLGPCTFRALFYPHDRCRPETEFYVSVVCDDRFDNPFENPGQVIEYVFQWCCVCEELAKMWCADAAELEVLDRSADPPLVFWERT